VILFLLALQLAAAAPQSPEAWLKSVQHARAALQADQPDAVVQLRGLTDAEVTVSGDAVLTVRDPLLSALADALELGVPAAREEGLRHLAMVERQAAALVAAPPLPRTSAPLVATAGGGAGGAAPRRQLGGIQESLRGWATSVSGGAGEAGALLLVGGVITCGLVASVLLSLKGLTRPAVPAPPAPVPRLPTPSGAPAGVSDAVRAAFLEILLLVESRGWVPRVALTTNGRVAEALDGLAWERFRVAQAIYERTWYGGAEATEGDLQRVREALEVLQ